MSSQSARFFAVLLLAVLVCLCRTSSAFVSSSSRQSNYRAFIISNKSATSSTTSNTRRDMLPLDSSSMISDIATITSSSVSSSNMWISTIDSDIANIPANEFAPVFMGGIIVMFGGVLSALIVGFILEKGNLYTNVVADSYSQGGVNDEEFWRGLSEEEKVKAQALIKKLNEKKAAEEGGVVVKQKETTDVSAVAASKAVSAPAESPAMKEKGPSLVTAGKEPKEEMDMFSDYSE